MDDIVNRCEADAEIGDHASDTCPQPITRSDPASPAQNPEWWRVKRRLGCIKCNRNLQGMRGPVIECPGCGYPNLLRAHFPWNKRRNPPGPGRLIARPLRAALCTVPIAIAALGPIAGIMTGKLFEHPEMFVIVLGFFSLVSLPFAWLGVRSVRTWLQRCDGKTSAWIVLVLCLVGVWLSVVGGCVIMWLLAFELEMTVLAVATVSGCLGIATLAGARSFVAAAQVDDAIAIL